MLYFQISEPNRVPRERKKNEVFFFFFIFEDVPDHGSILRTTFLGNLPLKYLKRRNMDVCETKD